VKGEFPFAVQLKVMEVPKTPVNAMLAGASARV
jgi:hypothetical protein